MEFPKTVEFPKHDGCLPLTHIEHKSLRLTAEEWIEQNAASAEDGWFDWVSPEERERAKATDNIWTLRWRSCTPVGVYCLAASDLTVLLNAGDSQLAVRVPRFSKLHSDRFK